MSKADTKARPIRAKANMVPMVAVASTIAKGDPPECLVLALANFQDFVGGEITSEEDRRYTQITEQMHDAAGKLILWLPAFMHMPTVIKPPDEVHIALEVLPKIKAYLARAMNLRLRSCLRNDLRMRGQQLGLRSNLPRRDIAELHTPLTKPLPDHLARRMVCQHSNRNPCHLTLCHCPTSQWSCEKH